MDKSQFLYAAQYRRSSDWACLEPPPLPSPPTSPSPVSDQTSDDSIPTNPHTITRDIKTNMRHIRTSIVSRHLATRGNNKILAHLHHTLAALKIYFPASLVTPLPNSEQINHPSSNKQQSTTHGNTPKGSGSYPRPKTHTQHTQKKSVCHVSSMGRALAFRADGPGSIPGLA